MLCGECGNLLQAIGLVKGAHKLAALLCCLTEDGDFAKDDGPGVHTGQEQDTDHDFGHKTAV